MRLVVPFICLSSLFAATVDFKKQFSGNGRDEITAIASDAQGNVYLAGRTSSFDFPVKDAIRPRNTGSAIVVSEDGGETWSPLGFVPSPGAGSPAQNPRNPSILLVTAVGGIFRSVDSGRTWQTVVEIKTPAQRERFGYVDNVAWDPFNPSIVYAGATGGVLKSSDEGQTWTLSTTGLEPGLCCIGSVVIPDPLQAGRILYTASERTYVSMDSGTTWARLNSPAGAVAPEITLDPSTRNTWLMIVANQIFRTTDAGATWSQAQAPDQIYFQVEADPSVRGTFYARGWYELVRSTDGGLTWTSVSLPEGTQPGYRFGFTAMPGRLIISTVDGNNRVQTFVSTDQAATWRLANPSRGYGEFRASGNRLYAAAEPTLDAFLVKLDRSGEIVFATYLGGQGEDAATALAVDARGDIYVAGTTRSADFEGATARLYGGAAPALWAARLDDRGRPISVPLFGEDVLTTLSSISPSPNGLLLLTDTTRLDGGTISRLTPDGAGFDLRVRAEGVQTVAAAADGGFYIARPANVVYALKSRLTRLNAAGDVVSSVDLNGSIVRMLVNPQGDLIVAGGLSPSSDSGCPNNSGTFFPKNIGRVEYMTDILLTGISADLSRTLFSTAFGGTCRDYPSDLALANDGSLWMTGSTWSETFPSVEVPIAGPPPPEKSRPFLARWDPAASRLMFSSYMPDGMDPRVASATEGAVFLSSNSTTVREYLADPPWSWVSRLSPAPAAPFFVRNVVNDFSRGNWPVSPMEIVNIELGGFDPGIEIDYGLNPPNGAPFELGGATVRFNGIPAPLLAVRPGEIRCVTPEGLLGASIAEVTVTLNGVTSPVFELTLAPSNPTFMAQIRNDDNSINTSSNPARAGSPIAFFLTGVAHLTQPLFLSCTGDFLTSSLIANLEPVPGFVPGLFQAVVPAPAVSGGCDVRAGTASAIRAYTAP